MRYLSRATVVLLLEPIEAAEGFQDDERSKKCAGIGCKGVPTEHVSGLARRHLGRRFIQDLRLTIAALRAMPAVCCWRNGTAATVCRRCHRGTPMRWQGQNLKHQHGRI